MSNTNKEHKHMHVLSLLDCPRQLQLVAAQHTLLLTLYVDLKRLRCYSVWSDGISRHNKSTGRMINPCCFQMVRRFLSSTQASAARVCNDTSSGPDRLYTVLDHQSVLLLQRHIQQCFFFSRNTA